MNYRKIIDDSFSTLTPLTANEEIMRNVTERAEKMEKKKRISIKKPIIAVCAAVAAVAVGTISVGAVNGWNYAEVFQSLFGEKTGNIMENIVPEAVVLEDTLQNIDVEIAAAAADKHGITVILDFCGKNGYKFAEDKVNEKTWFYYAFKDFDISVEVEGLSAFQGNGFLINGDADKIRMGYIIYNKASVKNTKVNVCVTELIPDENDDSIQYFSDNKWSAKFVADFKAKEIAYKTNISLSAEKDGISAYITADKIEVSPVSVCVKGEISEEFFYVFWDYENSFAVTDNGEKIRIINYAKENTAGKSSEILVLSFAEPVNPEEITCIDLNGHVINLK